MQLTVVTLQPDAPAGAEQRVAPPKPPLQTGGDSGVGILLERVEHAGARAQLTIRSTLPVRIMGTRPQRSTRPPLKNDGPNMPRVCAVMISEIESSCPPWSCTWTDVIAITITMTS